MSGDEDCSSQALRRPALSRAQQLAEDLIVDLTELEFADASLMIDLAMVARRLRKAEATMSIRGAQPQIEKLIEIAGLHRLPSVKLFGSSVA
ncbi:MAG TPA: STAS domain-containing protein [Baekduia sp.]|nr:STAS domain-containing protein [Baekduia sp.]